MSEVIYLTNVRLSFPTIVEAKTHTKPTAQNPNPQKYFSADILIDPNDPQWKSVWGQIVATAQEKWGEHAQAILDGINGDRKARAWGNGTEKVNRKTMQPYAGYANNLYVSLNRREQQGQPQLIKPDGNPVSPTDTMQCQALARQLYGGCRVNVALKFWPQDNDNGRAIRADFIAIQFAKDDEAFGEGTPDASSMFGAVSQPAGGPSPAGAPVPTQSETPFGQPSTAPAEGMPAAPFGNPGLPPGLGGE